MSDKILEAKKLNGLLLYDIEYYLFTWYELGAPTNLNAGKPPPKGLYGPTRRRGRLLINLKPPSFEFELPPPPRADLMKGDKDRLPILGTEFNPAINSGTIPSPVTGDIVTP